MSNKIIEYVIWHNRSKIILQEDINGLIKKGLQPLGGICIEADKPDSTVPYYQVGVTYYQVMVRYEDKT
jgi:hypothetical protein